MKSTHFALAALFLIASQAALGDAQSIGVLPPSRGKAFNPDIGVNLLGLLQRGTALSNDRNEPEHNGFRLQEAEIQLSSDVDVYFRALAMFGLHQEEGGTEYGIDPEEVYVETISLPHVTVRAGKYFLALGKHNQLHHHAFPFIDAPLIHERLLGHKGLNEAAFSAAALLPTSWYSEVILQGFNPSNEVLYASPGSGDIGGLARLRNLFELSDDLTLEFGLTGTAGKNAADQTASIRAADLTFKWRPSVGGKYHSLVWQTEYLGASNPDTWGGASWVQYQFAERWWLQARGELLGDPDQSRQSALLGFFPSEFSGLRLQYDHLSTDGADRDDHAVALQFNIGIGAHPAHAY